MATIRPPLTPSPSPTPRFAVGQLCTKERTATCRQLSPNELAYYLLSRGDGVNDIYLHLGFRAPERVLHPSRIHTIWAIQRLRHPLLASRIVPGLDVSSAQFEYARPGTVDEAIDAAVEECAMRTSSKEDLLSAYLNGPRLLSASRTSFLIIARDPEDHGEWHLLLCAVHCTGDGMALHACANEMLLLLGGGEGLRQGVAQELEKQTDIPRSMEAALPEFLKGLKSAAAVVDDRLLVQKQIGGQAFPKTKGVPRRTVVQTTSFDEERTKRILAHCKENGASISNVVFALCNIAWARMLARGTVASELGRELPILMYTALNARPWLDQQSKSESFFKLCIGYFNVILPSFVPSDRESLARRFWYRARLAKAQCAHTVRSPFVVARIQSMTRKRAEQSVEWARLDDVAAKTKLNAPNGLLTPAATPQMGKSLPLPTVGAVADQPTTKQAPSIALMGLSLLGNLDGTYQHVSYGDIKLHTLTIGNRQRASAMLLSNYTFVGKLWFCFGYDENGFTKGVVEEFWKEVLDGVDEFLGL